MKKTIIAILALVMVFIFVACDSNTAAKENETFLTIAENTTSESQTQEKADEATTKAVYHKISQEEVKRLMDEGSGYVIDVREQYEYDEGHIKGAILSPLGNIQNDISNITEDKDTLILVYCRSGNRSQTATNALVEIGYTNVHDFGGIVTWEYDVEK